MPAGRFSGGAPESSWRRTETGIGLKDSLSPVTLRMPIRMGTGVRGRSCG